MLHHKVAVDTFPHVVVTPVHAIDVYHHRIPCLVDDGRAVEVHQSGLEAVQQPGPYTIVAGVTEHEGLVLGVFPVIEELGVEVLFAVNGLGTELNGLLGQVKAEVTGQLEAGSLTEYLGTVQQVVFDVAFLTDFAELPVNGVLEGQLTGYLGYVGTGDEHACFLIPQDVRVAGQGHNGQGVIGVNEVSTGGDGAGLQPCRGEGSRPKHGGEVQLQRLAVVRRGRRGGDGTICGIVHRASVRDGEAGVHGFVMKSRFYQQFGGFCVA